MAEEHPVAHLRQAPTLARDAQDLQASLALSLDEHAASKDSPALAPPADDPGAHGPQPLQQVLCMVL